MILAKIFGHEIINFEFKKLLSTTVSENRVTIFRGPTNVANLRCDKSYSVRRKNIDFFYLSQIG